MGDILGISISIGGVLPTSLIDEFLEAITEEIDNLTGPYEKDMLLKEIADPNISDITFNGASNNGTCDLLTSFCVCHDLSYIIHIEGEGDYNAETIFYTPEEGEDSFLTNATDDFPIVSADEIKPLIKLLLALLEEGQEALPKYINVLRIKDLVALGLEDYSKLLPAIQERLDEVLPKSLPDLPPLIVNNNA